MAIQTVLYSSVTSVRTHAQTPPGLVMISSLAHAALPPDCLSTNHPLRVLAPVLNSGHPDVDIESMIYPLLSSAQRKAMDSAMAGRHETLQQRTYSTGASIARLGGD